MLIFLIVKDIARWFFWFPFRWILGVLPFPLAYTFGSWLGYGFYFVARNRRKKTELELRTLTFAKSLDKRTIRSIVRQAMVNLVLNHIDILLYQKLAKIPVERYTEIQGLTELQTALNANTGVILAHPHFGNAQMLMAALGYRNYKINQIGRALPEFQQDVLDADDPLELPPLTPMLKQILELIHQLELSLPAKFIYIHKTLLPAFRCLKRNEVLAIAIDGLGGENRVVADIEGRQLSLSSGPVAIALRSGAPILPTFILRSTQKERHKIIIEPPIALQRTGDETMDLTINTKKIADRIGFYLVNEPSQIVRLFGNEPPYFIKQ